MGCLSSMRMWGELPDGYNSTAKAMSVLPFSARPQITMSPMPCTSWVPAPRSAFDGVCHDDPGTVTVTAYEENTGAIGGCRETGLVKRLEKEGGY